TSVLLRDRFVETRKNVFLCPFIKMFPDGIDRANASPKGILFGEALKSLFCRKFGTKIEKYDLFIYQKAPFSCLKMFFV
ncbi:MAG: hypothetical protein IJM54_10460, partial [Thermoguttaceae bacterium]|nr:hypothetical protein [Thermoguttaceae bacterium]